LGSRALSKIIGETDVHFLEDVLVVHKGDIDGMAFAIANWKRRHGDK
jgi:hypothetical protein